MRIGVKIKVLNEIKKLFKKDFIKHISGFSLGTIISRVTGLLRESTIAYLFGAGLFTDAFYVAFRIPNLLRDFFAETALSASFIPVFVEKKEKKLKDAWRFTSNVYNLLSLFIFSIVIFGILFSPFITRIIAPGFLKNPYKFNLTVFLTRIMFPFLLFISLSAVSYGVLNSFGSFFLPAVSPAVFNIVSVAFAFLLYGFLSSRGVAPITGMAIGAVTGVFLQFLLLFSGVIKKGFSYKPVLSLKEPGIKTMVSLWVPVVLGLAAVEINVMVDTLLASLLEEASVSYLSYAYRVMHLPLAVFGIAIGSVSLPRFSKITADKKWEELRNALMRSIKAVNIVLIPLAVFFIFFSLPITRVIYERGAFTFRNSFNTAQAVALYTLGIWAASNARVFSACFYSLKNSKTPMRVGLLSVGLNLTLNLSLMHFLRFRAFALTTSACSFFSVIFLWKKLHTHYKEIFKPLKFPLPFRHIGISILSIIIPLACWGVVETYLEISQITRFFMLFLLFGIFTGSYYLMGKKFRLFSF